MLNAAEGRLAALWLARKSGTRYGPKSTLESRGGPHGHMSAQAHALAAHASLLLPLLWPPLSALPVCTCQWQARTLACAGPGQTFGCTHRQWITHAPYVICALTLPASHGPPARAQWTTCPPCQGHPALHHPASQAPRTRFLHQQVVDQYVPMTACVV